MNSLQRWTNTFYGTVYNVKSKRSKIASYIRETKVLNFATYVTNPFQRSVASIAGILENNRTAF